MRGGGIAEEHRGAWGGTWGYVRVEGVSAWDWGRGVVVGRCPWGRVGVLVGACGRGNAGWEVLERICSWGHVEV